MKHEITEAIQTERGIWSVTLKYWNEGECKCTAQQKTVIVHKETRPLLRDAIKEI